MPAVLLAPLNEKKFLKAVDAALKGVIPAPWPAAEPASTVAIPADHKVIALGCSMADGLDGTLFLGDFVDITKQTDDGTPPTIIVSNVEVYHAASPDSGKQDLINGFVVGPKSAAPVAKAIGDPSTQEPPRSSNLHRQKPRHNPDRQNPRHQHVQAHRQWQSL